MKKKGFDEQYLKTVILKKEKRLVGMVAPPKGLFLWSVEYPQDIGCEK